MCVKSEQTEFPSLDEGCAIIYVEADKVID